MRGSTPIKQSPCLQSFSKSTQNLPFESLPCQVLTPKMESCRHEPSSVACINSN